MERSIKAILISVVTGCRNEEGNLEPLYDRISVAFRELPDCDFELIVADNASTDGSREVLRKLCSADRRVKAIFNARNFGPERSGGNAVLQASGEAVICMAADLQNPPELIPIFVRRWKEGHKVVGAIKTNSDEALISKWARNLYYEIVNRMSYVRPIRNFTGFGLYDRKVIEAVRQIADPDPFFRGAVAELGYRIFQVSYVQPARVSGKSSYNLLRLIDHGILGLISMTKVPLRLATLAGFCCSIVCFLVGLWYLVEKLLHWHEFVLGSAPLVVGLFMLASIQLLFIGIIGEYIGAIYTKISRRPLVSELERINF